ncbi:uncharacterized protein LOC143432473 isoform X2 [Xylocopa sonorina]|uniref:uncharacterized protein LOC143432473 isoform X2 n=1 Tax=Xylocopa sonorina TaxID=1818115 RepID=UPI00403AF1CC
MTRTVSVLIVLLLSVIPWPGPSVFKISCPRDRASVVRRIVQKRWIPILKKHQVELPLECPFHESRDIFRPQQRAKHQHRPSQWTCGLCGKSFYAEKHLDAHFDNRHKSNVNTAEDAVCLADYCDIMRCDVLGNRDFESSLVDDETGHHSTDIQVWKENTEQRSTAMLPCDSRGGFARTYPAEKACTIVGGGAVTNIQQYCHREDSGALENHRLPGTAYHVEIVGPDNKSNACDNEEEEEEEDEEEEEEDEDEDDEENLVEAALPAVNKKQRRKGLHLRKLKANCKPEELQKLKLQCEILVRDCIAGLLTNLSVLDFQEIEGELNRAICWYLSCDRYWEDTKRQQRHSPWYLLTVFLLVLFSSIYVCYYIIWVLFNSAAEDRLDETGSLDYTDGDIAATSSSHDQSGPGEGRSSGRRKGEPGDDNAPGTNEEMPDHYIYVTYPPELKQRLLDSCYNRTTRL